MSLPESALSVFCEPALGTKAKQASAAATRIQHHGLKATHETCLHSTLYNFMASSELTGPKAHPHPLCHRGTLLRPSSSCQSTSMSFARSRLTDSATKGYLCSFP